ncbi:MAG: hypothetical protein AB2A00_19105 [Myxococcota bacterium]
MLMSRAVVVTFLAVALSHCASSGEKKDTPTAGSEQVAYYRGNSTSTSPDGSTPFGQAQETLVMRVVSPKENRILEKVRQGGRDFDTTLLRVEGSNKFTATDQGSTFTGTLTFEGQEWAWNAWTYDITMADGSGKIEGKGTLGKDGIKTEKYFVAPDGNRQVRIIEELKPITKDEYEKAMAAATPPAAPPAQ